MTTIIDDRTDEQRARLTHLVIMTDRFLSGWGGAEGGASYAAWACAPADRYRVLRWVESRTDALRVREAAADSYRPSSACAHFHIYAVDPERGDYTHTALR